MAAGSARRLPRACSSAGETHTSGARVTGPGCPDLGTVRRCLAESRVKESLLGDPPLSRKGPFHRGLHTGFSQPQLKQTATAQSTTQRFQPVV